MADKARLTAGPQQPDGGQAAASSAAESSGARTAPNTRRLGVKMEVNAVDDVERKKKEAEEGGGGEEEEEEEEEEEVDATGVTSMLLLSCA